MWTYLCTPMHTLIYIHMICNTHTHTILQMYEVTRCSSYPWNAMSLVIGQETSYQSHHEEDEIPGLWEEKGRTPLTPLSSFRSPPPASFHIKQFPRVGGGSTSHDIFQNFRKWCLFTTLKFHASAGYLKYLFPNGLEPNLCILQALPAASLVILRIPYLRMQIIMKALGDSAHRTQKTDFSFQSQIHVQRFGFPSVRVMRILSTHIQDVQINSQHRVITNPSMPGLCGRQIV